MHDITLHITIQALVIGTWDSGQEVRWPFIPVPGQKVNIRVGPGHVAITDVVIRMDGTHVNVYLEPLVEEKVGDMDAWAKELQANGWS